MSNYEKFGLIKAICPLFGDPYSVDLEFDKNNKYSFTGVRPNIYYGGLVAICKGLNPGDYVLLSENAGHFEIFAILNRLEVIALHKGFATVETYITPIEQDVYDIGEGLQDWVKSKENINNIDINNDPHCDKYHIISFDIGNKGMTMFLSWILDVIKVLAVAIDDKSMISSLGDHHE